MNVLHKNRCAFFHTEFWPKDEWDNDIEGESTVTGECRIPCFFPKFLEKIAHSRARFMSDP
jgi:hypothetical protein